MNRFETISDSVLRTVRKGELWCAFLSLSLSLSVASATFQSLSYGRLYLIVAASFFFFFLLLSWVNGALRRHIDSEPIEKEKFGVLLLSQFSVTLFVLGLFAGEAAVPPMLRTGLHFLALLLVLSMAGKAVVSSRLRAAGVWTPAWGLLDDDRLLLAGLVLPIPLTSALWLVAGRPLVWPLETRAWPFVVYSAVILALMGAYLLGTRLFFGHSRRRRALALYDLNTSILLAGAPLSLAPLAITFGNELQHAWPVLGARVVAGATMVMLVLISAMLVWLQRRGQIETSGSWLLHGVYFPALVATLATFSKHRQTLEIRSLDYFGLAEQSLPSQQWLHFGSVPLLDLLPTQGLADFVLPAGYTLINGSQGLDMLIWLDWLPEVVGLVLIYAFLAKVSSPVFALLATVSMPVKALFFEHYAVGLLPAVLLLAVVRRPTFARYLTLWLVSEALVLWRPDLGLAAAAALVVIVAAVVLTENRAALPIALGSLCIVLTLVPAAMVVTDVLWAGDSYKALKSFLSPVGHPAAPWLAAADEASGPSMLSTFHRQVLPAVALVCVLYFGLRKLVDSRPAPSRIYAVLFVALLSLFLSLRSAVGQPSDEVLDPFLFLALVGVLSFYFVGRSFHPRMLGVSSWFLAAVVVSTVVGAVEGGHLRSTFRDYSLYPGEATFQLRTWQRGDRRVFFDEVPHRDLVEYLQLELGRRETFFDFTGSPLLYVLADQKFPTRMIADFASGSESLQQEVLSDLERLYDERLLKWVILSSPRRASVAAGQLPLEAASPRVAEFVYRHYRPYVSLAEYELWLDERIQSGPSPRPPARTLTADRVFQDFELGRTPGPLSPEEVQWMAGRPEIIEALIPEPQKIDRGSGLSVVWERPIDSLFGVHLHIRGKTLPPPAPAAHLNGQPALWVLYGEPAESRFAFELAPWSFEDSSAGELIQLELGSAPEASDLQRLPSDPKRLVYRTIGPDPYLHGFVDLARSPSADAEHELWLRLRYRSSNSGALQVFFAVRPKRFSERQSVRLVAEATRPEGSPAEVVVPVIGRGLPFQLADLRLDPPRESIFEVVGVEIIRRRRQADDYLIRLSTQWRWVSSEIRRLTLRSNTPVLIDSVQLMAGE